MARFLVAGRLALALMLVAFTAMVSQSATVSPNSQSQGANNHLSTIASNGGERFSRSFIVTGLETFGVRLRPDVREQALGDPPPVPACPGDSLLSQVADGPSAFTAYTSEQSADILRFENFSSVAGAITGVRWFGLDLEFTGSGFVECTESDPTFEISFYEDNGGTPGAQVCSYTLLAERIPTGVLYQGTELNEYRVTLPSSCIVVNGWISIVGYGDPDCWFLWMSAVNGDQYSICDGCQSTVQADDLSFCLLGMPGGILGACCNLSTGQCVSNVEINQCAVQGLKFTPNVACGDLNPPCQVTTGACCAEDGSCALLTFADCSKTGGTWRGPNTPCSLCPILGACCLGFTTCVLLEEDDCVDEGGSWQGANTQCGNCPSPPQCPKGSLFAQDPEPPTGFLAGTSEESSNLRRAEYFDQVPGAIDAITWWGLDMIPIPPNQWMKCAESDPTFKITFHKDAGGLPGDVVCSYTLLATRTPLGISYLGSELNEYQVQLPSPCAMVRGWISIVGLGDPNCWFLWMSSGVGESWCDHCIPSQQGIDLSVCLQGQFGGVFGACCDDATSQCVNNIEIDNCMGATQRFEPNALCGQLNPPCGVVLGACCYDNATCSSILQSECAATGGNWLGPNTICSSCPCVVPCPENSVPEGEQICSDEYIDVFNGGCAVANPAFSFLQMGTTVCGHSGVFLVNLEATGDWDFYEVHVGNVTTLTWSVRAEFRTRIRIYKGGAGCPAQLIAAAAATECFDYSVSANVQPGIYWLMVGPLAFDDTAVCGAKYFARPTIDPSCSGDIAPVEPDFTVNVVDMLAVINNWGACASCPADLNLDGDVNVLDLLSIINSWGPCGLPQ
jgi:hypothetical protein